MTNLTDPETKQLPRHISTGVGVTGIVLRRRQEGISGAALHRCIVTLATMIICGIALVADVHAALGGTMDVHGESLVLAKSDTGNLCFDRIRKGSLTLRSTFAAGQPETFVYEEGRDYTVDYAAGTVARTAASRIPDYSTNVMYGKKDFDHTKLPSFSNHAWFVFADYQTTNGRPWARPNDQRKYLRGVRRRLETGGRFLVASYGDSITAGGEASKTEYRFQYRFAAHLQSKFPKAAITVQDASIPGYSSRQGIEWFDRYIGKVDRPDVVLVGFGMNDHNVGGPEPEKFKENLIELVKLIRERKGAEVILFSAFPPNDDWHYGTHRMAQFAAATKQAAKDAGCAYADVFSTWEMVLKRKDQSSLLGNNINHPYDFGHWLYEQAFEAMRF